MFWNAKKGQRGSGLVNELDAGKDFVVFKYQTLKLTLLLRHAIASSELIVSDEHKLWLREQQMLDIMRQWNGMKY